MSESKFITFLLRFLQAIISLFKRKPRHYIRFGPHRIHRRFGTEHFLICGSTGSGKTLLTKELMRSLFEADDLTCRACFYNAKSDMLPTLFELAGDTSEMIESGTSRVKVLDPWDVRGCAWDIALDLTDPIAVRQFFTNLIMSKTKTSDSSQFFDNAVVDIATTLTLVFINAVPNNQSWTLRDVIHALQHEPVLRELFALPKAKEMPAVARVLDSYYDCDPRTASNIRSTISSCLAILEPIAASWEAARKLGRTFSLREWAKEGGRDILVLGNGESGRASYDAVNQAIFRTMAEVLLEMRELNHEERMLGDNQTWIILDESKEAGDLNPGLQSLALRGRSKGVCLVLTYQSFDGLVLVYSLEAATELTDQLNNKAFLRTAGESTAKRGAEAFGSSLRTARSFGISSGENSTHSFNSSLEERPLIYSADLLYLDLASKKNGISGYYLLAGLKPEAREDAFGVFMPPEFRSRRRQKMMQAESVWLSDRYPRPVADMYLKAWDTEDWERLGFEGEPPSWHRQDKGKERSVSEMMQDYLDSKDPQRGDCDGLF